MMEYKELLSTFNPGDIAFVKSLLEAHGIQYYIQGEDFLYLRPMAQPAGIMVDEAQFQEAKELLGDFKGKFTSLSPREERLNDEDKT